ncbi:MAG: hypothetical protein J5640_08875 [Bacteroidales bacterium]|nr:hypothetical protein [Bacteroidales bacterium]
MPHILLAALALCFASPFIAGAQELGLFSSPKGIGASVHFPEKDGIFHTLHAYVDIYGVATSRCSFPGYKANFSRQYVCGRFQRDGYSIAFYAGPGLSLGYVRDHDKGRGFDLTSLLADNEGMALAISGDAGFLFDFGRNVFLDLSWTAEAGIHLRRNEAEWQYDAASMSLYNNGLLQAIYPQLTILFRFK